MRSLMAGLDEIMSMPMSEPFADPVDESVFPDYRDVVDQPMDLATIRKRIASKHYTDVRHAN